MNKNKQSSLSQKLKTSKTWENLISLVFPRELYCICCGKILTEKKLLSLCDHCFAHLGWNDSEPQYTKGLKLSYCLDYHIYSRTLIFDFKYRKKLHLLKHIGLIMVNKYWEDQLSYHVLVPVPMHKSKEHRRGFNQARLMAEEMSKELGIPVVDCLVRTRETRTMRGLGPYEREANISGSIELKPSMQKLIEGKDVLIIDDFFTTGATAKACSDVLIKSGHVRNVAALTFASKKSENVDEVDGVNASEQI